jgi:hypothetical protein
MKRRLINRKKTLESVHKLCYPWWSLENSSWVGTFEKPKPGQFFGWPPSCRAPSGHIPDGARAVEPNPCSRPGPPGVAIGAVPGAWPSFQEAPRRPTYEAGDIRRAKRFGGQAGRRQCLWRTGRGSADEAGTIRWDQERRRPWLCGNPLP